jgi:glycosyltransferase involved in cell wall biosynthesis
MAKTILPRILHVVRRLDFGGLEVGVVNLVCGLERLGFAQLVCCLEDRGALANRLPESVPVWTCAEGRRPQRLPWRAARCIRDWRPEVVHARNGGAWIDATTAWLLAGRRGRLVFSFHGWDRLDRMPRQRAFLYRRLARMTNALAAVSTEAAQQFAEEAGIAPDRFTVLSSGVDTEQFRPPTKPKANGRVVLGCVGRLDPVKAHDVLIEAFACIAEGPGDPELHLLGDGPCRADLERLARQRGIADRVRFLGMAADVSERLREMDLFVLASHREGRPTSIMEAMATGLPVVATRVGSVPELVAEGRTGLLVDPGDATALARALGALITDEALRRRLAEEARRVAVAELSLDRMVAQYAAFYRDIARPR